MNGGGHGGYRGSNDGERQFGGDGSGNIGNWNNGGRNAKCSDDYDTDDDEEANVDSSTGNDDIVSQNDEVFKC